MHIIGVKFKAATRLLNQLTYRQVSLAKLYDSLGIILGNKQWRHTPAVEEAFLVGYRAC